MTGVGLDPGAGFPTTHWSILLQSGEQHANEALAKICRRYWYPLYAFLRRSGNNSQDAQDLTQGYFAHILTTDRLGDLDPNRGRFRSYLLGGLKHFVADTRRRELTLKRGGQLPHLSVEQELAEERFQNEPSDECTADNLYDRQWALEIFRQVLQVVERDYVAEGKEKLFKVLHPYLTQEADRGTYGEAALELGVKEVTVRSLVSRLRKHYRARLRDVVLPLVESSDEVDREIEYLFGVMS